MSTYTGDCKQLVRASFGKPKTVLPLGNSQARIAITVQFPNDHPDMKPYFKNLFESHTSVHELTKMSPMIIHACLLQECAKSHYQRTSGRLRIATQHGCIRKHAHVYMHFAKHMYIRRHAYIGLHCKYVSICDMNVHMIWK